MSLFKDRITVGRKLSLIMKERMLSNENAAADAHITEDTLTKLLRGSYEKPGPFNAALKKLLVSLGLTPERLMLISEEPCTLDGLAVTEDDRISFAIVDRILTLCGEYY